MLTAEKIQSNWDKFMSFMEYISEDRRTKLIEFYNKYQDRIMMMPAAHKKEYHSAFAGGYLDHIIRVMEGALKINEVWITTGVDTSTYTIEELIFSAMNHDLGKMGDEENESYIPQTDNWRKEKLGEDYMFNNKIAFASVPDRGLFLLQSHGIPYSFNEMITIQTHDGLYDEANKKYLMGFMSEQKPRTSLPFIVHQADLMAARIEWEIEWLHKFKNNVDKTKKVSNIPLDKKQSIKNKALKTVKSEGVNSAINDFFK